MQWDEQGIVRLLDDQRRYFATGATLAREFRTEQLRKLRLGIERMEAEIAEALRQDLNKSHSEAYTTEIGQVLSEITLAIASLGKWMKPRRVRTAMSHIGSRGYIRHEPYGSILIITPWNYPFMLSLVPIVGAIAAGNCVVLKPSELSSYTSRVLARLIGDTFDPAYIAVTEGGPEVSGMLLEQKFDYILFTGGTKVGRIVAEAAAKQLTPVTLELGGKSPCIVHKDADLKLAAKRIAWGKVLNAGQICVAPDYILVHEAVKPQLLELLASQLNELAGDVIANQGVFPKIINQRHFERIVSLIDPQRVVRGGRSDESRLLIEPTVIDDVSWGDPIMQEEIFGPLLPVIGYADLPEAIARIKERPKPLALYLFSSSKEIQEQIMDRVSFGGGCINDTIMHIGTPFLPFGGVGESGAGGGYRGKHTFEMFSHHKAVLKQTTWFDLPIRYMNSEKALRLVKKIMK